jgi:hypothetical protein
LFRTIARRWFAAGVVRRDGLLEVCLGLVVLCYYLRHFALRWGDPDLWGRLAVGQLFVQRGSLPRTDPFAYTPTLPSWIDHEWLTGVVFFALHALGGDAAILLVKTALGLGAVGFACLVARLNGARWLPLVMLLIVAMPVFGYGMMPRAQVFTYFLFAVWLYVLELVRQGRSAWLVAILPPTMLLWANLHGGFLAGLGLLALYVFGACFERRSVVPLLLAGCGCLGATLLNPYGMEYWCYLIPAVSMHRPNIAEWAPVPLSPRYWQFWLLSCAFIWTLWQVRHDARKFAIPLLVVLVTLVLAVRHARHMPLAAIAGCAFLPAIWSNLPIGTRFALGTRFRPFDAVLFPALLAVGLWQIRGALADGPLRLVLPDRPTGVENMVDYPVGAIDAAIEQQVHGNLATPFNWGEYAIWRLYPACRVAMDGRYETVYPTSTVQLVETFFAAGTSWHQLIDEYPTDLVLAPTAAPVNSHLERRGWQRLFADSTATLWRRP